MGDQQTASRDVQPAIRTAEETLQLLEEAIRKRRAYLRRRLEYIGTLPKSKHGGGRREIGSMLRSGMLSEMWTVTGLIGELRCGRIHPSELWNEEDDLADE